MKILCIIPARGGSKGVPGKNIKALAGEPMIAYTFKEALKCKNIDRIILTTDDEKIAKVGREYGIEVPFIRPSELASDKADSFSVFRHALEFLAAQDYYPDGVLILQPTSPLRESEDIAKAINLMKKDSLDQVISITPVSQHPYWMKTIENDNLIKPYLALEGVSLRRQDLPPLFIPNGAIYLYKPEIILNKIEATRVGAITMEEWKSIDIDTPLDFFLADKIMDERKKEKKFLL